MVMDKIIKSSTEEDLIEMIRNYEILHRDGDVEGCKLRDMAHRWIDEKAGEGLDTSGANILLVMDYIGKDCYGYFGKKYLVERGLLEA